MKNWISQLNRKSGRGKEESLVKRVESRTESKALVKSKEITRTKDSVSRKPVTWSRRVMMEAVVDPVGLKANW